MLNSQTGYYFGKELKVYDREIIAPGSSLALGFTAGKIAVAGKEKAIRAWLTVEGADVRYSIDGVDPTSLVGHLITDGGYAEIEGITNLTRFKIIAVSGTPSVTVSYSRYED